MHQRLVRRHVIGAAALCNGGEDVFGHAILPGLMDMHGPFELLRVEPCDLADRLFLEVLRQRTLVAQPPPQGGHIDHDLR